MQHFKVDKNKLSKDTYDFSFGDEKKKNPMQLLLKPFSNIEVTKKEGKNPIAEIASYYD